MTTLQARMSAIGQAIQAQARQDLAESGAPSFRALLDELVARCAIERKPHQATQFVDVALMLMAYPTELACAVGSMLPLLATRLGFNPFGVTMVAMAQMDQLYRGMFVRLSLVRANPRLAEAVEHRNIRCQRAGEILACMMLGFMGTPDDARETYHNTPFGPDIRPHVDAALNAYDAELARYIIAERSAARGANGAQRSPRLPGKRSPSPGLTAFTLALPFIGAGMGAWIVAQSGGSWQMGLFGGFVIGSVLFWISNRWLFGRM